jgi:protein involved in polysaccharide export with SLBB domain
VATAPLPTATPAVPPSTNDATAAPVPLPLTNSSVATAGLLNSTNPVAGLVAMDPKLLAAMMDTLDDRQKLGGGDKVIYRVIEDQDLPKSLTVTDTGELDVPYFGLVPATGKTCRQLAQEIKSVLEKELYYRATVVMGLELINKKRTVGRVYVVGQVKLNGPQDMLGDEELTVSKAILRAGGFSDFADKKKVRISRAAGEGQTEKRTYVINVAEIWEKGQLQNDLKLEPDDLVFVPARLVNF